MSRFASVAGHPWFVPFASLLGAGAVLGLSANLAKLAAGAGLSPLAFLAWSVTGAAIVLTSVGIVRTRLPPLNRRTLEYFVAAGLIGLAAPNLLSFAAVPHLGAGFVTLTLTLSPLFTYLGALAIGLEAFRLQRAAGVTCALAGTGLLAFYKLSSPTTEPFWVGAALLVPVLLAGGNLYRTARWPPGVSADELAPGMLAAAGFLLLVVGTVSGQFLSGTAIFSLAVPLHNSTALLLIMAQILVFSAMYLLYFVLQRTGGPVYLSFLGSVAAIVGVPIAVFVLGETPPQGLAIGGFLIALGICLVTLGTPDEDEEPALSPAGDDVV